MTEEVTDALEQIISAWAFAHDIDGAARNDLFARMRSASNSPTTEKAIEHMVQRFLAWKLPKPFGPDNYITFDPPAPINAGTPYENDLWPTGTNLFNADQAKDMVRHMIEGLPNSPTTNGEVTEPRQTHCADPDCTGPKPHVAETAGCKWGNPRAASDDVVERLREALATAHGHHVDVAEQLGMNLMDGSISCPQRASFRGRIDVALKQAHAIRAALSAKPIPAPTGEVERWQRLALKAISFVEDAEKDTNWGQPTFGPTFSEELQIEADEIAALTDHTTKGAE